MDKCREEFEKWAKNNGLQEKLSRCMWDCEYVDTNTQFAFIGFEGALKHQQAKVDDLQNNILFLQGWEKIAKSNGDDKRKYLEEVELLQKRVDAALTKLDQKRDELWFKWKEGANMYDQVAANAFEEAYWILEQALKGE